MIMARIWLNVSIYSNLQEDKGKKLIHYSEFTLLVKKGKPNYLVLAKDSSQPKTGNEQKIGTNNIEPD